MPVRDVVQNGAPHKYGAGSGKFVEGHLLTGFAGSAFTLRTTDSDQFCATEVCSKEMAIGEGRRLGSDYVLQVELGEFRNAAPMTFRTDYVTLKSASMYDVRSGEAVWTLEEPVVDTADVNWGNHLPLLENLAEEIAESIIKNAD